MVYSKWVVRLLGLLALLGLSLSSPIIGYGADDELPLPVLCSESDRFGVAAAGQISGYDMPQLNARWYHNFTTVLSPLHPGGMDYVQVIRLADDGPFVDRACSTCPLWTTLQYSVENNPGSIWTIGNEPDRQDYIGASRYAELYHEFYTFIKDIDPTSQVGPGGVVQPTPIRLQYLDLILAAYRAQNNNAAMPVDVWTVHNYVLREGVDGWGCGIPPGTNPALARDYSIQDHDSMVYWAEHLTLMRQWMLDRGYRDRPLLVTEYGILMPEIYLYDYERVSEFMLSTFDWFLTATNPNTGLPSDGNRMVQGWAWYSLNDPAFEGFASWNHLFDPDTRVIMPLGLDYSDYTEPLTVPLPGTVDLVPVAVRNTGPDGSGPYSTTVIAHIENRGAAAAANVKVRFSRNGTLVGDVTIPAINPGETQTASMVWNNLALGEPYLVTVVANPDAQIAECNPRNNELTGAFVLLENAQRVYLPIVHDRW